MSDYSNFNSLIEQLETMDSDTERWQFIIQHPDTYMVLLDNDDTQIKCVGDDRDEYACIQVDYIGCSDGIFNLCEALGLNAEGV